jgi:hypothetical protein
MVAQSQRSGHNILLTIKENEDNEKNDYGQDHFILERKD